MKYLSVCSGIEAASVAWHPLGWSPVAFAEIEKFPSAVLAHRYPNVPNLGDLTKYREWSDDLAPNLIVGGTPCQSFSVAGLRKGMDDPRGNLALVFLGLVDRYRPRWVVWENVPGVRSSGGGRDFGAFLGALGQLGYGWAYRSLDAQYFGLAQRRERVFVVGCLGDWRPPAAVLFERESLSGHPAPRRETGKAAPTIPSRSTAGGGLGTDFDLDGGVIPMATDASDFPVCGTLSDGAHMGGGLNGQDAYTGRVLPMIAHTLRGEGFDASEDGTGRGAPLVFGWQNSIQQGASVSEHIAPTLDKSKTPAVLAATMAVRRLTPTECERLQGFPDGWTAIPWRGKLPADCPDGPRYKALGNSMAVPCMRWIGERIAMVDALVNP